jgi:hypothetical protein
LVANKQTNKPKLLLSDGSSVLLQPNSKLSYQNLWVTKEKYTYLEGFFEISKNPKSLFCLC